MRCMNAIHSVLTLVDAYRSARGLSDARVSTLVFNDGGKVKSLRGGRDIGVRRAEQAIEWFAQNWPANAEWPLGVRRPPAPSASLPEVASAQHLVD